MPDETEDTTRERIDAEKLAALIDGRLSEDERREMLQRIGESEDDLDVMLDAAGAVADLNPTEGSGDNVDAGVIPLARRRSSRWRVITYAGITAAAAATVVFMTRKPDSANIASSPGALVAALSDRSPLPADWEYNPWSARRGESSIDEQRAYTRIGVRAVDLEMAFARRDSSVSRLASEMEALLQNVPSGSVAGSFYGQLVEKTDSSSFEAARSALASLPQQDLLSLGAWLEAARIAAARNDSEWFKNDGVRQTLSRLSESIAISPTDRESMGEMLRHLNDPQEIARRVDGVLSRM